MKHRIFLRYLGILSFIALVATSCNKNNSAQEVYIPRATTPINEVFSITDQPYQVGFTVSLSGVDFATQSMLTAESDINVEMVADTSLVSSYNEECGTNYLPMPTGSYTVPTTTTIKQGTNISDSVFLSVSAKDKFGSFVPYLLPIRLSQATGASIYPSQQVLYVALVGIADANSITLYDRSNWSIVDFSTEEPAEGGGNGLAVCAIDNNSGTFWQTKWAGGEPGPPHYITIDMGQEETLHGVAIMNRNFSGDWATNGHGQPQDISISISDDNVNWTEDGSFSNLLHPEGQPFTKYFLSNYKKARYLKITVTAVYGANSTNIAEIGAF